MRRIVLLAFLGLAAVALVPGVAAARSAEERLGTIVVLNGPTVIAPDQVTSSVVVFHGRTVVEGHATGTVVVFDGATRISGTIDGTVVVFSGRVVITEGAHIGGDLITNAAPDVAKGARIDGERRRVSNFQFWSYSFLVRVIVWFAFSVSVLALGMLLLWLFPSSMEHAGAAARTLGASFGWGALLLFGLPIATILVAVTAVGLPLGLSMFFALWFLATLGYTIGVFAVGRMLVKPPGGRVKAFFAGFGILRLAALVPVLGGLAWTLTTILGLGAATVAVWRRQKQVRAEERREAPAPEPAPPAGSLPRTAG